MIVSFILFILLIIYGLKIDSKNDYLSKEKTAVIKGIFIILVFFSHFNSYVTYTNKFDISYLKIVNFFGQAMVAPFLFYSGYGIMEQINQKGRKYIKKIPFKRIFITLLKFDIAVLIFLIIKLLFKEEMSLKQILLSLIGWDSLGNSNWYIFTILMLYIFTYISFILIKNKKISFVITTCLTCIYIIILYHFNIKPLFWYDTALCYILGMFYSLFKEKIYKYINFNNIIYIITLILTVVSCLILKKYSYYASINILYNLIFSILIVIITMRVLINNKILLWCGEHLFEIYILQRIPMIIFQRLNLFNNIYLFFVVCVVITLIVVLIFKKIVNSYILKKFSLNK